MTLSRLTIGNFLLQLKLPCFAHAYCCDIILVSQNSDRYVDEFHYSNEQTVEPIFSHLLKRQIQDRKNMDSKCI